MSANAALFVFVALLCLHAARSLPRPETLDDDCCLFLQASAYRPTTESVVDENGHVVGQQFLKDGSTNQECKAVLWRNLLFTVAACEVVDQIYVETPIITVPMNGWYDCKIFMCRRGTLPDLFSRVSNGAAVCQRP